MEIEKVVNKLGKKRVHKSRIILKILKKNREMIKKRNKFQNIEKCLKLIKNYFFLQNVKVFNKIKAPHWFVGANP